MYIDKGVLAIIASVFLVFVAYRIIYKDDPVRKLVEILKNIATEGVDFIRAIRSFKLTRGAINFFSLICILFVFCISMFTTSANHIKYSIYSLSRFPYFSFKIETIEAALNPENIYIFAGFVIITIIIAAFGCMLIIKKTDP
jgi:hypothetical protein